MVLATNIKFTLCLQPEEKLPVICESVVLNVHEGVILSKGTLEVTSCYFINLRQFLLASMNYHTEHKHATLADPGLNLSSTTLGT